MLKESRAFLRDLVDAPSPSGYEGPAQKIWMKRTRNHAASVRLDVHGNAIAVLNPKGSPRVMLAGHCDEIGFMVKYIADDGFVSFAPIGGIDIQVAAARRVTIHGKRGPVPAVLGRKPVHLLDRDKPLVKPEWHQLWFDIGAGSRKEAEKLVELGDPATFHEGFLALGEDKVCARGFDDKAGAFVVSEVLRLLGGRKPAAAVYAVSTVQEELGLRGATTAAYAIDPQVGIAVDVTFASDHPEVDKKMVGEIILGKGPVIARGANINPKLFTRLAAVARRHRIPYQVEPSPRATGTDANVMQLNRSGVAAALVAIPNRYMHTPVEMIALSDLENAARLLAAFVLTLRPKDDFTPFR
jgi:putative aminopeptidase FrvX